MQPNVANCRSSCKYRGAGYFTYIRKNHMCLCKDSDTFRGIPRLSVVGRVSGETSCTRESWPSRIKSTSTWRRISVCMQLQKIYFYTVYSLNYFAWPCLGFALQYLQTFFLHLLMFKYNLQMSTASIIFCIWVQRVSFFWASCASVSGSRGLKISHICAGCITEENINYSPKKHVSSSRQPDVANFLGHSSIHQRSFIK